MNSTSTCSANFSGIKTDESLEKLIPGEELIRLAQLVFKKQGRCHLKPLTWNFTSEERGVPRPVLSCGPKHWSWTGRFESEFWFYCLLLSMWLLGSNWAFLILAFFHQENGKGNCICSAPLWWRITKLTHVGYWFNMISNPLVCDSSEFLTHLFSTKTKNVALI